MAATNRFDAIVIGSGISGGWAAKELTEKGLRVLMVDRGHMVEHGEDYTYEGRGTYEIPARDRMPKALVQSDYQGIQNWVRPSSQSFFINDRLNPYDSEADKPFHWVRSGAVGGKSLIWGRWCFRWAPGDFEANKKEGIGTDWPIRYEDVEPWYAYVEKYAGISGGRENLPYLPDSEFMPPMPMNIAEKWLKEKLEAEFPGRKLINARLSNITQDKPEQGRTQCQKRNQCHRGCSFGGYFSTQAVTLPAARATGRLTLRADTWVTNLEYDPAAKRVTGVRLVDAKTGQAEVVKARVIFLCASAMGSVHILLNSRPTGSGQSHFNNSGKLGTAIMDHVFRVDVSGDIPGMTDYIEYGRRPSAVYVPRFRNLNGDEGLGFRRGYGYQGGASRQPAAPEGFGASMKHGMRKYGGWRFNMGAFGECLPYDDNRVTLNSAKVDDRGMPLLRFDVTFRENERRLLDDAQEQGLIMLRNAGLQNVTSTRSDAVPGDTIHEMGGARMGAEPTSSVLDKWNRTHDAANLYVTDGAQMASVSCVNPSLTFMAVTARAVDHAVKQMAAGVI